MSIAVSFRQQCMISWNNHALLPEAYLYGDKKDTPSTPGDGGCDQSRTSVRLVWRDWSGTNEALGVCSRDAAANRLIVDSVDHGIRQQYLVSVNLLREIALANRRLTVVLIGCATCPNLTLHLQAAHHLLGCVANFPLLA